MTRRAPLPMPPRAAALLAAAVVFGLLACVTGLRDVQDVPPQGWWEGRGPVVPHDTFPADCTLCHEGDDWHTIREDFEYDHEAHTGFRLEGAHADAQCIRCHNDRGPVTWFASKGCVGCHEDVHRGQLGRDCSACHDQSSWRQREVLELHARTRFPLIGAHASAACWRCHPGAQVGNFTPVDTECITCHAADLARATDPDHQALGLTDSCERCHIPTTWSAASFRHVGITSGCADCHLDDYLATTDPDHQALAFPQECEQCHSTQTWLGAAFDHGGIATGCADCHLDDYLATTDPDHQAFAFPQDCELCHTTRTWQGALFDHSGITRSCQDCHLDDYLATTDPDHQAASFPTSCETCHTTRMWEGATFDHLFDITGGDHGGFRCNECHQVPRAYSVVSCTHCHDHRQREMDDEHDAVRGYVWESSACVSCHPTGAR